MDIELAEGLTVDHNGQVVRRGLKYGHIAYVTADFTLDCWKRWLKAER